MIRYLLFYLLLFTTVKYYCLCFILRFKNWLSLYRLTHKYVFIQSNIKSSLINAFDRSLSDSLLQAGFLL